MRRIAISLLLCFFLTSLVFAETPIAPSPYELAVRQIEEARNTEAVILDLSSLGITELPDDIASLDSVRFLLLGGNNFSSFPIIVTEMTALENLDLSHNELSSLPPEIGNLSNLQQLHLSANMISSLPPEIGNLGSLISLSLDYNQLSSLPPEITELRSLISLYVNSNQLRELPDGFGNLRNLCNLDISNNQLTKIRSDILALPSFSGEGCQFYFMGNPFEAEVAGQVPPTPARTGVRPSLTPRAIMIIYPTAETAAPTETLLGNPEIQNETSEWDYEKLLLGGAALMGVFVSFFLGMRLRRDTRKRKPKD